MQIVLINEANCLAHADKIALIHGLTHEDLKMLYKTHVDNSQAPITSTVEPEQILTGISRLYSHTMGSGRGAASIWLFTGNLAQSILEALPVHGCTLMENDYVVSALTWAHGQEMLGRVFAHEWCHSRRLVSHGFRSQAIYIQYLANPAHWLYEELLALATEKYLFPHLSWESAAGFQFNPRFAVFEASGILRDVELELLAIPGTLNHWLEGRETEQAAFIYYLAYRLCRVTPVTIRLKELMMLSAEEGLAILTQLSTKPGVTCW